MGYELAEKYKVTCLFKVGTAHSDCIVNANCRYVQSNCILGPLLRLSPKLKQRFKVQCPLRGSLLPLPYNSPQTRVFPFGTLSPRDIQFLLMTKRAAVRLNLLTSTHPQGVKEGKPEQKPGVWGRGPAVTRVQLAGFPSILTIFPSAKEALDPGCLFVISYETEPLAI